MLPKLLSPLTVSNRPDIVDAARAMMRKMSPHDIAAVQRGMADRPDSVATLKTIGVPTLIVTGADDSVPLSEAELMRQSISGSRLQVIPRAGHYAAWSSQKSSDVCCGDFWMRSGGELAKSK